MGLDGIGYYQQQNQDKKGSFNDILTIQRHLQTQKGPSNLICYIKDSHPFDLWNKRGLTYDRTTLNRFNSASFDTKDYIYLWRYINFEQQKHKGPGLNYLILKYKGPKHFLDDDKDYYLGSAFVHNDNFKLTRSHLHFNPVRKTLSLYQNKHNYDKAQKDENNKRTRSDW
nr:hypothetical protein [Candidatus Phytoplasma tritici]